MVRPPDRSFASLPPGCRPPPEWAAPAPSSQHAEFGIFHSTLTTMKKTGYQFGSRAFHFLSFVFLSLKAALKKRGEAAPVTTDPVAPGKREVDSPGCKKKGFSLTNPEQFLEIFEKRPEKVLDKFLDLLLHKPEKAKEVLLNLAQHWRGNPEAFIQYDKSAANRPSMRAALNDVFKRYILTDKQLQLQARIVAGKFTEAEAQIMSSEPVAEMTPKLEQFQRDYQALKEPEALGQVLWDSVCAFLDDKNEMEDLSFIDGEERSFDRVIEAMLYHRSLTSLRSPDLYLSNQKLLLSLLTHLQDSDVLDHYPTVKALVDKAHAVLRDAEKADRLNLILLEVLAICDPLSKSPPRRT